jgi:hypothetical protein
MSPESLHESSNLHLPQSLWKLLQGSTTSQVQVCEAHQVADALWKLLQGLTATQVQVCEAHQVADALWKLLQGTAT